MTSYKYKIGTKQGVVEAEEYTTAVEKIKEELGLNIELVEEDTLTEIMEKYYTHSSTFIGIALDMEDMDKINTFANILTREYRIYLLDELNTEDNDISKVKNFKNWEEEEMDRLLETSGVDIFDFPEWIKNEYV